MSSVSILLLECQNAENGILKLNTIIRRGWNRLLSSKSSLETTAKDYFIAAKITLKIQLSEPLSVCPSPLSTNPPPLYM